MRLRENAFSPDVRSRSFPKKVKRAQFTEGRSLEAFGLLTTPRGSGYSYKKVKIFVLSLYPLN